MSCHQTRPDEELKPPRSPSSVIHPNLLSLPTSTSLVKLHPSFLSQQHILRGASLSIDILGSRDLYRNSSFSERRRLGRQCIVRIYLHTTSYVIESRMSGQIEEGDKGMCGFIWFRWFENGWIGYSKLLRTSIASKSNPYRFPATPRLSHPLRFHRTTTPTHQTNSLSLSQSLGNGAPATHPALPPKSNLTT